MNLRQDKDILLYLSDNQITKGKHKFAHVYKSKKAALLAAQLYGTAMHNKIVYLQTGATLQFIS